MGFLKNLMTGREISRLEELVQTSPAPSLFVRLSQLYREREEAGKADEVMRAGLAMFPESEILTEAQAHAQRIKNEAEKARLIARIEQYPSAMLYAKLAEIYIKERDFREAKAVCERGVRAYPSYGGLWSVLAEIQIAEKDYAGAKQFLEKACEMDKYNYQALMILAEVGYRLGEQATWQTAFARIFEFAPGDEKATRTMKEYEETPAPTLPRAESAPAQISQPTDEHKGSTTVHDSGKHASGIGTNLHSEIREIRRVQGVEGTVLIDPYGMVIASDLPKELDEELVGALITNICRASEEHARQLTLGQFEDGIIDGGTGSIHILRVSQMIMAVFAQPNTKAGLLQRAIHTFAERVIETHY